jgi:hypothetical protein
VRLTAGLAAVTLALLAGCGGGGSGSESFREDALEICRDANDRIREWGTPESFTETQLFARRSNDAVGDMIDELEELEPPPEQADQFELYLESLEERRRILARLTDAADRNSMNDLRETGTQLQNLGSTAREQASAIGLAECEPR